MSRFKIKLRLPEQDSSSSITASSSAQTMEAASPQDKAATTPTPLTSQNMRENDAGESSRGQGDVSMAAASSMADESEDELASGDDDEDDDLSRGGTPSSSTAATAAGLAAGGDDRNSPAMRLIARQKRSARLAELEQMTAEEIDALPPAKRRVGAKARGASGPGRGWRKGLKMGDKPKYTLPDTTPIAEGTPNSFDDSRRESPFSAMSGSPEPSTLGRPGSQPSSSRAPQPAAAAPLAFAAPGQRAKKGELSHTAQAALAGKSILPSGRAPVAVAAAMAFGPPVKPPVKIVNVFPPAYPASARDVGKKCRKWVKGERQWVNLAGRVVKIGTWWGGEDDGYDPAKDEVEASTLAPASAMSPSASRQATPSITTGPPIEPIPKKEVAAAAATASSKSKSSSKSGKGSRKSGAASSPFISAASPSSSAGATKPSSPSQLPKPKFQPGGGGADWKSGGGAGSPTPGAGVGAKK